MGEGGRQEALGDPADQGLGHNTARLKFDDKVAESANDEYVLPHVRSTVTNAMKRAGIDGVEGIDGIETRLLYDLEYMAIDTSGYRPWRVLKAVEKGWLEIDGKHPINPSGGLIGAGHPVGATAAARSWTPTCG